jgi:hypothetical protein
VVAVSVLLQPDASAFRPIMRRALLANGFAWRTLLDT